MKSIMSRKVILEKSIAAASCPLSGGWHHDLRKVSGVVVPFEIFKDFPHVRCEHSR